jgi:ribosomal protein S18 acetylase RimI-like enzyme
MTVDVDDVTIRQARFPDDAQAVRALFAEYAASLGIDLGFQDFEAELAALPGKYTAPDGAILLACRGTTAIACVALRRCTDTSAEMKRLYVRPSGRGLQLGRKLAEAICGLAAQSGYASIRLDTLPDMVAAQQLYGALGFKPIDAYVFNPIEGTQFLERDLRMID